MKRSVKKAMWFFSGTVGWVIKIIATILVIGTVTAAICTTVFALYIDRYIKPNIDNIRIDDMKLNFTSFVYATDPDTGETIELEQLYSEENRIWADYPQMPQNLLDAVVSVEDSRFHTHHGVDWVRTFGAMVNMVIPLREGFGGGSTLTQQLIKNITGEDDITVQRKIQEILRALEFEKLYTKEQILELYLNTVYFGHGCDGVETAAQTYFGKTVSDLTLAECATIVGITKSPTYYDPLRNPENNKKRQELILSLMYKQGYITEQEYKAAVAEKLAFNEAEQTAVEKPKQSYYVDQVINDVIAALVEEKGYSEEYAKNILFSGGVKVYANVDLSIQAVLDDVYKNADNFPTISGDKQPESAMVIMEPYTGVVLAMVGGRGEKTVDRAWNRATQTKRQPGSSIKPLTVYGPALEYGFITPNTVFDDSPLDEETRWPKNQSSGFSGRMTVKKAIQLSTNTVAVKVLNEVTPERAFNFASVNLGLDLVRSKTISGKVYSDVNLAPLGLGGLTQGLSVLEMTAAYSAFVNKGVYTEPRTFSRVEDASGNVILENKAQTQVAMKEKTAYYMNNLLRNVVEAGTGKNARLENMPVAGKTGTTDEDNDRWFVGYTPYYVAAVWFGYDTPKEIKLERAYNPSIVIWKTVMEKLHAGLEYKNFFQLETVQAKYCIDSGLAPTEACYLDPRGNRVTTGTFLPEDVPTKKCDVHTTVTIDKVTGMRATPYCPAENLTTISLMKLDRSGLIGMSDDAYMWREPSYSDTAVADGSPQYNIYCTVHKSYETVPNVPDDWLPDGGSHPDTDNSSAATGATSAPETEPETQPETQPETEPETEPETPPDNTSSASQE